MTETADTRTVIWSPEHGAMTSTPENVLPGVLLHLNELTGGLATFTAYLRMEPEDGAAAGFGLEGGVQIRRDIGREEWEQLGSPVVLPVRLVRLRPAVAP